MNNEDKLKLTKLDNARLKGITKQTGSRGLTEKQKDMLIAAGSKVAGDISQIVTDVVAISRIRAEAEADEQRINAETRRVVLSIKSEIERLAQIGNNVRNKGEIVVQIIHEFSILLKEIPEIDNDSRHILVDSLKSVVEAAVKE